MACRSLLTSKFNVKRRHSLELSTLEVNHLTKTKSLSRAVPRGMLSSPARELRPSAPRTFLLHLCWSHCSPWWKHFRFVRQVQAYPQSVQVAYFLFGVNKSSWSQLDSKRTQEHVRNQDTNSWSTNRPPHQG